MEVLLLFVIMMVAESRQLVRVFKGYVRILNPSLWNVSIEYMRER